MTMNDVAHAVGQMAGLIMIVLMVVSLIGSLLFRSGRAFCLFLVLALAAFVICVA
jgi:hypothetical protein